MKLLPGAIGVALLVSGCGPTVASVSGPDGEAALAIRCSSAAKCYERANRLCPSGYVIRDSGTTVSGVGGRVSSGKSLLVSCKSDLAEREEPSAEERKCEVAYRQAPDFADYFASLSPHGKRLSELPTKDDFVAICTHLPGNVRRCLQDKYREEHKEACDAVLTRLEPRDRNRIDGLFFGAPSPTN